ncbi:hypothetical protein MWG07_11615 [Fusobacterium necrophorum]|uniref:Uncharacterized protein n=1 Tax=Fusobacterium necrophorum TaxID=859 RepID=A0AAW6WDU2_9FUSO|nr:hypothetical protein [Fusobacterium necrophorum]MDK4482061.1 hypothetical protein [Fusobacterium necrophorum]MDK4512896.1 hypothetical protein [Fusobacterium necrophorum]
MDLSNLIPKISISDLNAGQKRSCLLSWVAMNLKLRLKDYHTNGGPTAYSTRLWAAGRGKENTRNYMRNLIRDNINLNVLGARDNDEIYEILQEMAEGIVEESLIICEQMFVETRRARTERVREKYWKAVDNLEYLRVVFIIAVSNYAETLIRKGVDIDHALLTIRLGAVKKHQRELRNIWRNYAESEKTIEDLESANNQTETVFNKFEKEYTISEEKLNKLTSEKLLYEMAGDRNIEQLVDIIVDEIRERVTGAIRLIPVDQF